MTVAAVAPSQEIPISLPPYPVASPSCSYEEEEGEDERKYADSCDGFDGENG